MTSLTQLLQRQADRRRALLVAMGGGHPGQTLRAQRALERVEAELGRHRRRANDPLRQHLRLASRAARPERS